MTESITEKALKSWGIHRGFPAQRKQLAAQLDATGKQFDDTVAKTLFLEAKEGRGARNPAALVASWLDDGSWVELYEEIEESQAHVSAQLDPPERNMPPAKSKEQQQEDSMQELLRRLRAGETLAMVCELNGWDKSRVTLALDKRARKEFNCSGTELVERFEAEREQARRERADRGPRRQPRLVGQNDDEAAPDFDDVFE